MGWLTGLLVGTGLVWAQDEPAPQGDDPSPALEEAVEVSELSDEQLDWLKPTRGKLPPNPYAWAPWAAYGLEWGEARLGLSSVAVGALPRTELSTSLPLFALTVPNVGLRVNALRAGPVDLGLEGAYYRLGRTDFSGGQIEAGARLSVNIKDRVGLHLGGAWATLEASGLPDLGGLSGLLSGGAAAELEEWNTTAEEYGVVLDLQAQTLAADAAIDVRLNRRDSIVLLGGATLWSSASRDLSVTSDLGSAEANAAAEQEAAQALDGLPPVLLLDQVLDPGSTVGERILGSYRVGVAYQASWRHATLRLGVGTSAVPFSWLLQTTELSWRFGGKTRGGERRMMKGWRRSRTGESPETP